MSDRVTPFTRSLNMARKLDNISWVQCRDTLDHLVQLNPTRAAAMGGYLQKIIEQHMIQHMIELEHQYAMDAANNDSYGDRA